MTYKYKIFPFLKHYKRKKDGKRQLMLRVKIGYPILGRVTYEKEVDIKVLNIDEEPIKLTEQEFNNRRSNGKLISRLYELEGYIAKAIYILRNENIEINAGTLFNATYTSNYKLHGEDELIENEDTREFYDHPIPKKVWESFQAESFYDDETESVMPIEDVQDAATIIEGRYYGEKLKMEEDEKIRNMSYHERYKKGYYDKNNIFDCFGFCWTRNPKNNDILVPKSYRALLLRLYDYKFNANPPEHINYFNQEWIDDFLKFLVSEGYSSFKPKGYEPFNFDKYKVKLVTSPRKSYRYSAFQKIVKLLKRYILLMKKYNVVDVNINQDFIEAKDYVSRAVNKENFTRLEHSLTVDEFELLSNTDFKDSKLNLARDMFIIAVLGGGFRGEEFYNQKLKVEKRGEKYILHAFHTKTDTSISNIAFKQLHDVLKRYDGKLPSFLNPDEFKESLLAIAKKLNFERTIISPNTYIDSEDKVDYLKLKDIFSIYFARKTCVNILDYYGIIDEEKIGFTNHSTTKTLNYYKRRHTLDDKERILKKHGLL